MSIFSDIDDFFRSSTRDVPVDLHHIAHAVEDLPADAQAEGALILKTPLGQNIAQRSISVLENAVIVGYGEAETVRVLHFLSQYPVKDYTYDLSSTISRGERPDTAKILALHRQGFGAIINLCAETPEGDAPLVKAAGVDMLPLHYGVEDGNPPTLQQAADLLAKVRELTAQGIRVYIHCEAGKTRTGCMSAVIRMAMQGWGMDDALTEAKNFGLSAPMQIRFIQDFGRMLEENWAARTPGLPAPHAQLAGFPLLRPGSVRPTAQQLSMTLDQAAAAAAASPALGAA